MAPKPDFFSETVADPKEAADEEPADVKEEEEVEEVFKPKAKKYNTKFAGLGGGSTCKKCGKGVGFADKVKALGGDWHKDCFRCSTCSMMLRQGEWRENKSN